MIHKFKLNAKLEYQNKKYELSLYICLHLKPKQIWTYLRPCQTSVIEYFCGIISIFAKKHHSRSLTNSLVRLWKMMAHQTCYLSSIERNKIKKEISFLLLTLFCYWWSLWRGKIQPQNLLTLASFLPWKNANHVTYRYTSCYSKNVDAFSSPLTAYNFKNMFCLTAFLLEACKHSYTENGL